MRRLGPALRLLLLAFVAAAAMQAFPRDANAGGGQLCVDFFPTMDPLAFPGGCYPNQGADQSLVVGRAIIEDRYAPIGTAIEAFNGDASCGAAPIGFRTFELQLNGCASPGETVRFEVGGQLAIETMTWPGESPGPTFLSLSVKSDHAWYWFERLLARPPAIGTVVQAVVDGVVCGETMVDVVPRGFVVFLEELRGFWKLVVPSSSLTPGCGAPGANVSFVVDGVKSVQVAPWQPGIHQVNLMLAGDPNCDFVVAATDAALVLQTGAGLLRNPLDCQPAADVNNDGSANAIDATLVLQFAAGLLAELPP
jgi:hypothetical protein